MEISCKLSGFPPINLYARCCSMFSECEADRFGQTERGRELASIEHTPGPGAFFNSSKPAPALRSTVPRLIKAMRRQINGVGVGTGPFASVSQEAFPMIALKDSRLHKEEPKSKTREMKKQNRDRVRIS